MLYPGDLLIDPNPEYNRRVVRVAQNGDVELEWADGNHAQTGPYPLSWLEAVIRSGRWRLKRHKHHVINEFYGEV